MTILLLFNSRIKSILNVFIACEVLPSDLIFAGLHKFKLLNCCTIFFKTTKYQDINTSIFVELLFYAIIYSEGTNCVNIKLRAHHHREILNLLDISWNSNNDPALVQIHTHCNKLFCSIVFMHLIYKLIERNIQRTNCVTFTIPVCT